MRSVRPADDVLPFSLNSTGIVALARCLCGPSVTSRRHAISFHASSFGKYFITESTGLGAACPARIWMRPSSHRRVPSAAADPFRLPDQRQRLGVPTGRACTDRRIPRRRISSGCAPRRPPVLAERITTAASDKQPYWFRYRSRADIAIDAGRIRLKRRPAGSRRTCGHRASAAVFAISSFTVMPPAQGVRRVFSRGRSPRRSAGLAAVAA